MPHALPNHRAARIVLSALFCAALALPGLLAWIAPPDAASVEREFRRPAPKPQTPRSLESALAWPRAFDAWFSDHYGLRAQLIRWNNALRLLVLGESPTSEIVAGPGPSLFTTRDRAVDVFRGADPFSERELALWTQVLADRRAWCEARGVKYVFAIAPNKESIYPERFPARFDKIGPTRREQLLAHLSARADAQVLDLTDAVRASREEFAAQGDVYFPLGTHWNDYGAFAAYRALLGHVGELVPGVRPRSVDEFEFAPTDFQDDTWAGRLYLEDLLVQPNVELRPRFASGLDEQFHKSLKAIALDAQHRDSSLPRAVVFHDSMGEKLRPLLAEHFSRCVFRWESDFDTALIERERPDVVIQVFVERALAAFSLSTSPLDTQERCAQEFAASSQVLLRGLQALEPDRSNSERVDRLQAHGAGGYELAYAGGGLLLPEFDVPPGTWPVLRVEFDAPAGGSALLEFKTARFAEYSRRARGVQRPTGAGANVLYFKLRVPALQGRLRLHPGLAAGVYVLRDLEVRAVSE